MIRKYDLSSPSQVALLQEIIAGILVERASLLTKMNVTARRLLHLPLLNRLSNQLEAVSLAMTRSIYLIEESIVISQMIDENIPKLRKLSFHGGSRVSLEEIDG